MPEPRALPPVQPVEMRKPLFNPKPVQPIKPIEESPVASEEDELEIPAFIRKKMK